jgi:hypothetical protein
MNRQERESIVQSVKAQVLAGLTETKPTTRVAENWSLAWVRTQLLPWVPVVAIGLSLIYWQFFFDLRTSVDSLITSNKTVSGLDAKINGATGQPGISDRLAKIEGSVEQMSKDLHDVFQNQLRRVSELPPAEFKAEIPDIAAMTRLASASGFQIEPQVGDALRQKLATVDLSSVTDWSVAAVLISISSQAAMTIPASVKTALGSYVGDLTFSGGVFDLDGGAKFERVSFEKAVIRYRGGPVNLHDVTFKSCRFIFQVKFVPPPDGQKLTKTLLASNIADVKID